MIRSMTGFGRGRAGSRDGAITVELRSVNHRFLEVVPHLPSALQGHDERVRDVVRQTLRRGRITCAVTFQPAGSRAVRVQLDAALARRYQQELTRLARRLRLTAPVTLEQLLALPKVLVIESPDQTHALWPLLERALQRAVQQLARMRAKEGQATARDVLRHLARLGRSLEAIAARAPHVVTEHRARLERRLQELAPMLTVEPQRIAAEVALFAANADIAEELARLRSHIAQCRRAVHAEGEQGRTLDFIAQEMFRETNTIGSKANDYAVASHVIALKGTLEKIREQVQNIE